MASTRHRDFSVAKLDPEIKNDPITFNLAGEEFTCRAVLPGWLMVKFVAESSRDARGSDLAAIYSFFRDVLVPESLVRFERLMYGDEYNIELDTLGEITNWLVGLYTARPTELPSPSTNGHGKTGSTSEENADSTE